MLVNHVHLVTRDTPLPELANFLLQKTVTSPRATTHVYVSIWLKQVSGYHLQALYARADVSFANLNSVTTDIITLPCISR